MLIDGKLTTFDGRQRGNLTDILASSCCCLSCRHGFKADRDM